MWTIFGVRDQWQGTPKLIFHSKDEVLILTKGFEIMQFLEIEKDAPTFEESTKHWHIFHLVLRKLA